MRTSPEGENESARLAALRRYRILDTPAEENFDDITRLAARISGAPVALMSFVDSDRLWFKSRIGMDIAEVSRDTSICAHSVASKELLEVPNLSDDARFRGNSLVAGALGFRFYAGMPLIAPCGAAIGVLCVLDHVPRRLTSEQRGALAELAAVAVRQLEARLAANQLDKEGLRQLEDRAKSVLIPALEREIRTQMNAMTGELEVIERSNVDENQKKIVMAVRDSANAVLRVADDLIEASRLGSGTMRVMARPASLEAAIDRVVESLTETAFVKGLRIIKKLDFAVSPVLEFDPFRIRQVLFCLLGSAIWRSEQGPIEIRADFARATMDKNGQHVRISVTDLGVPADVNATDVNVPLPRTEKRLTGDSQTSGIVADPDPDLMIASQLAKILGGSLTSTLTSGRGFTATLALDLPMVRAEATPAALSSATLPKSATTETVAPGSGEFRILVAEDMEINQIVLRAQLEMLGFEADFADDGKQALAMWKPGRYSLIICDCQMPVMDGYEFTRKVRQAEMQEPRFAKVPIIAYTASPMREAAQTCQAAGMDYFLSKPVNLAALKRVFNMWAPGALASRSAMTAGKPVQAVNKLAEKSDKAAAPIEREELKRLAGADANLERELLSIYRASVTRQSMQLNEAIDGGVLSVISQVARAMKDSALGVAARPMAAACERVEQAAKGGERYETRRAMLAVIHELDRLNKYL
jgi:two-component system, sensor histidine kinase